MVGKSSLPFNHPRNLHKWHYKRRILRENTEAASLFIVVGRGWRGRRMVVFNKAWTF